MNKELSYLLKELARDSLMDNQIYTLALEVAEEHQKLMEDFKYFTQNNTDTNKPNPEQAPPKSTTASNKTHQVPHPDFWTSNQVIAYLDISKRTLQNYRNRKQIPFTKFNGKIYYPAATVKALVNPK
ncbi:MAG: helix-turn-helix domain-containing protein [Bacteroidales bacterium]|nr:helix-turn-helix domain-containing protein [Bacteroidales bacterium]